MRILCAIGTKRGVELVRRVSGIARADDELVLVHVTETGPRHDLNHLEGTLRPHHLQQAELDAAEEEAGRAMLNEALQEAGRIGIAATTRLQRGKAEQVIVALARELETTLVALHAREVPHAHPLQGPPSIGHTARFVVDHVPADVLIFREKP
jgi:nucleotide-binding universal stress UspA family protein